MFLVSARKTPFPLKGTRREKDFAVQQLTVYVLNKHGKPLMPCGPRKARVLLKEGRAKVVRYIPFTIQLLHGASGYRQEVYAARDRGLTQGVAAARKNGQVLLRLEVTGRRDISELICARASLRRGRRYRKTGYRPCRNQNRGCPKGWLAPSVAHLWYEHEKLRSLVESILPVTAWAEEVNRFDIRRMWDPGVKGRGYQEGPLKGKKNAREYVLERDSYRCVLCGSPEDREAHHVVWRFRGGSDRPENLVTLCENCHARVTAGEVKLEAVAESYRWPARLNWLNLLFNSLEAVKVPAWEVKEARLALGLGKEHWCDALAALNSAFGIVPRTKNLPPLLRGRFVRTRNRQLHRANPARGGKRPAAQGNRYLVNRRGVRVMRNDLVGAAVGGRRVVGYVSTLRTSGIVRLADWQGRELANVSASRLVKLQNRDSIVWEVN
ncbi:MAG: RNA-guided endonuclease IscB [Moorellales bacterium]